MSGHGSADGRSKGWLASVAIGAMVLDLLVLVLLHVLDPSVSVVTDPTSNYGQGPWGWMALGATFLVGVGSLAAAAVLAGRSHRVGVVLLAVYGVAKLGLGVFAIDVDPGAGTTSGLIHNVLGNIAFFVLPVAAVLISRSMGSPRSRLLAWLLVAAMVAVLAAGSLGVFGVAQRIFLVLSSVWILIAVLDRDRTS